MAWRQSHDQPHHSYGADGPFSFCTYPFLLNPRAKSKLLHVEARIAMTKVGALGNSSPKTLVLGQAGHNAYWQALSPHCAHLLPAVGMISCSLQSLTTCLDAVLQLPDWLLVEIPLQ